MLDLEKHGFVAMNPKEEVVHRLYYYPNTPLWAYRADDGEDFNIWLELDDNYLVDLARNIILKNDEEFLWLVDRIRELRYNFRFNKWPMILAKHGFRLKRENDGYFVYEKQRDRTLVSVHVCGDFYSIYWTDTELNHEICIANRYECDTNEDIEFLLVGSSRIRHCVQSE